MDWEAQGGNRVIPVKNIYYMLSYAFSALRSRGFADLATEDFQNADDLLAAILTRGLSQQVKRGLKREYLEQEQILSSPRGKIDVSASIKRASMVRHQLVCNVDEFSVNTQFNRILKTAGQELLTSEASADRKKNLRRVLTYLRDVDTIPADQIQWRQRYVRQDQTYRMLIAISHLVISESLQSSSEGFNRLEEFDERLMHRLYERFIREYFRQEHGDRVDARASYVPWALDDDSDLFLPTMQTDTTLTPKDPAVERVLIIDTKWYTKNLQTHHGKSTAHSANLYQMFSYVKNKEEGLRRNGSAQAVSGLVLYAQTDAEKQPQATYRMSGNEISIDTLDLDADFNDIRAQLDGIVHELLQPLRTSED